MRVFTTRPVLSRRRKPRLRGCLAGASKAVLALVVVLLAVGLLTHQGRVALKTAGLMFEVFPSAPAYPLRWFTDAPTRTEVRYKVGEAETIADVYRPAGGGPHGAFVFYIGVGPELRNRNVVRIAEGLARAGLVVMVPVSENLSKFQVVPEEKEGVIAAYRYLSSQPYVDPERVGIFAVSAGGSLVAVAAEDPRLAEEVRLLLLFGSYYHAPDVLGAITLRSIEVDGQRREWQPDVSVDVFRDMLLPTLPPADQPLLEPLFNRETTRVPEGLSPEGVKFAALLTNRDPARVPGLIAVLPQDTRALLAGISPSTNIEKLETELFLLHDRDDEIIPFTESRSFYAEAAPACGKHLTELQLFRHVEPRGASPLVLVRETAKLYWLAYRVLLRLT